MAALTLTEVLADLPDPRSPHGRIHPLPAVLLLVVLGLLLGRKSLAGIARLGRLYGAPLAQALGFRRGKTPTKSMLSELLRALDATTVEAALSRWVRSRLAVEPEQISLDGKTLKGSRDGAVPGQHLVAAYAPQVQAVLAQLRVDAKTNEHKAALQLLGLLPLAGKVVVGDAMFCQRDLAEQVVEAGADYVLMVKDNQPGLQTDIAAGFGFAAAAHAARRAFSPDYAPPAPAPLATTVDKGHGRVEKRTLRTTTLLTVSERWRGLAQGFELTRERTVQGVTSVEVVYGITSLGPAQAPPARLLELVRDHWQMENGLHYVRDVTLGEDACRVRKGQAPQVLAGLRNAVVHLLAGVAADSRQAAIERLSARPTEAMELIGIPLVE